MSVRLWIGPATAVLLSAAAVAASSQSVTFGGPLLSGVTDPGGVITSSPLLNISAPGGLATNRLGLFYITDSTGNAVWTYMPAPNGVPVYSKLAFSGLNQPAGVAVDNSGDVYVADSKNNRIIELTASGTQKVLVSSAPYPVGVAVDAAGNIFYSTIGPGQAGAVYKLSVGSSVPVQFGSGYDIPLGLAVDSSGNLFVADSQNDRIVKVTANGTQSLVLSGLNDPRNVAVDNQSNLFTDGPSGNPIEVKAGSTEEVPVLNNIIGPYNGLVVDGSGNVFAVSGLTPTFYQSSTEVIDLPQANVCGPGDSAGTACSSTISLEFWIWSSVNLGAPRVLTQGVTGLDFTDAGSSQYSVQHNIALPCTAGAITLPANGYQRCSVTVQFAPLAPGVRTGAVQIVDNSGNILVQLLLRAVAMGPQIQIAAEGASTITNIIPVNGLSNYPGAVAVDAAGNLYVTDSQISGPPFTTSIHKIAAGGSQTELPISNVFQPGRVEIDGAGNLYLPAGYGDFVFPPQGSTAATPPVTLLNNLHGITQGLALDGRGNAVLVDANVGLGTTALYRAGLDSSLTQISTWKGQLADIIDDPWLATVDTGGTFDASIASAGRYLEEIYAPEQTINQFLDLESLSVNFNVPYGSGTLALNPAGAIYFTTGFGVYDTKGRTIYDGGVGVFTVDAAGNLFVLGELPGNANMSLFEVPSIQQPFAFASTEAGTTSAAQVFTVSNRGNASMSINSIGVSGPFALAGDTTCSTSAPVGPGSSCTISVTFNPTSAGAASGTLNVAAAGLGTPHFILTGTGTAPLAATMTTLSATPNPANAGAAVTFTIAVAASGETPTGTLSIDDGATSLAQLSLSAGASTFTSSSLSPGTHSITAVYAGDATNQGSTSSPLMLTIAPISAAVTPSTPTTVSAGASVTASVSITAAASYAGSVNLGCAVTYLGQGRDANPPACSLNPASITLTAGSTGTATLTVATTAPSSANLKPLASTVAWAGTGLAGFLLLFARRRARLLLALVAAIVFQAGLNGCGSTPAPNHPANRGTATGTYTVSISSTAGTVTTNQSFNITVQ